MENKNSTLRAALLAETERMLAEIRLIRYYAGSRDNLKLLFDRSTDARDNLEGLCEVLSNIPDGVLEDLHGID